MKTNFPSLARRLAGLFISLLVVALAACAGPASPTASPSLPPAATPLPEQVTYADAFEYCAALGTIDAPDARYTGPQITDQIINGFIAAAGLQASSAPSEIFQKATIWRCMAGQVYACNFGANLPCSSKANTDRNPTAAMQEFCAANPGADFIPMSVTGHDTIYSFHCNQDVAEVLDQIAHVDPAGFIAEIWYPISPNASPRPEPSPTGLPSPALLGGSARLLFASDRSGAYQDLYLLDFSTSQVTRLTEGDSNTFPGPFSPDGSQILFTGFGLTTSYVGAMAADGANPSDLTQADVDEGFPAWSPDGSQIAFTSRRDGNNEIYLRNTGGSEARRLTNNPGDDFAPAWSPDGSQIAFVSDRERAAGMYSIYIMKADGSQVTRLTNDEGIDYTPAWSPDGKVIAFRSSLAGNSDIYRINVDGSGLENLTNGQGENWSPAWTPDGSLIAFQTNRDGNWEIYRMNADGSDPLNLTQNPADDQMPYWAPTPQGNGAGIGMPNPASVYCVQQGGSLAIEQRADLGQMGVCYFEDNRQCEEWALFRGQCPLGGLKVTGYITEAARFCAITGGEYTIRGSDNAGIEQGTCSFSNGNSCDAWAYYKGECSPNP